MKCGSRMKNKKKRGLFLCAHVVETKRSGEMRVRRNQSAFPKTRKDRCIPSRRLLPLIRPSGRLFRKKKAFGSQCFSCVSRAKWTAFFFAVCGCRLLRRCGFISTQRPSRRPGSVQSAPHPPASHCRLRLHRHWLDRCARSTRRPDTAG